MRSRFAQSVLALAFAFGALLPACAWADRYPPQQRSGPRDGGLPASVRRVQRETGGEVLRAQPIERDGREVYRLKVLTPQGRIRVIEDEPQDQQVPIYPRQAPQQNYPRQAPQEDPRQRPQQYPRQAPQQYPRQAPIVYPRRPQQQDRYVPPPHTHYPH